MKLVEPEKQRDPIGRKARMILAGVGGYLAGSGAAQAYQAEMSDYVLYFVICWAVTTVIFVDDFMSWWMERNGPKNGDSGDSKGGPTKPA